jgi:hypothetical protein
VPKDYSIHDGWSPMGEKVLDLGPKDFILVRYDHESHSMACLYLMTGEKFMYNMEHYHYMKEDIVEYKILRFNGH